MFQFLSDLMAAVIQTPVDVLHHILSLTDRPPALLCERSQLGKMVYGYLSLFLADVCRSHLQV